MEPIISILLSYALNPEIYFILRFILSRRFEGRAQIVISRGEISGYTLSVQGGLFDDPGQLDAIKSKADEICAAVIQTPELYS